MSAAVQVTGLTHQYDDKVVLHGVDFDIGWGEICGCLGPNGAGKTTTMKAIAGLLQPTGGTVRLDGHDPAGDGIHARKMLGYIPDNGGLYNLLTGREHLALVADLHQLDPKLSAERTAELAATFDMADTLDQRIDTLSKGQRQRVALACGLLHQPRILLLDEPLAGLDVHAARTLRSTLRAMADDGCAILYCSHILDVVERVCDRAVILFEGKVVADAPTAQLAGNQTLESVFHALTRTDGIEDLRGAFDDDA